MADGRRQTADTTAVRGRPSAVYVAAAPNYTDTMAVAPASRAAPGAGAAPAPLLERVRKVLLHERRTGLADRAAVGGLERLLNQLAASETADAGSRRWLGEAARRATGYGAKTPDERGRLVSQLLAELAGMTSPPAPRPAKRLGEGSVGGPPPRAQGAALATERRFGASTAQTDAPAMVHGTSKPPSRGGVISGSSDHEDLATVRDTPKPPLHGKPAGGLLLPERALPAAQSRGQPHATPTLPRPPARQSGATPVVTPSLPSPRGRGAGGEVRPS